MTTAEMEALAADLEWRMRVPPEQLAHTVDTRGCTCSACVPKATR